MAAFGTWLEQAAPTPENAFEAHFRLVSIHPFVDGNGRTARLLMTLLLLRGAWPPAVIRPEDRLAYLTSLERAQTAGDMGPYRDLMCRALDRSLDSVLEMVRALRSPEGP